MVAALLHLCQQFRQSLCYSSRKHTIHENTNNKEGKKKKKRKREERGRKEGKRKEGRREKRKEGRRERGRKKKRSDQNPAESQLVIYGQSSFWQQINHYFSPGTVFQLVVNLLCNTFFLDYIFPNWLMRKSRQSIKQPSQNTVYLLSVFNP